MFVVPEEQRPLDDLKVIRIEATSKVRKEHRANLCQLIGAEQFENLLEFVQEHDLLPAAAPRPALEEAVQNRRRGVGILFDVLDDAVRELLMVQGDALGLV